MLSDAIRCYQMLSDAIQRCEGMEHSLAEALARRWRSGIKTLTGSYFFLSQFVSRVACLAAKSSSKITELCAHGSARTSAYATPRANNQNGFYLLPFPVHRQSVLFFFVNGSSHISAMKRDRTRLVVCSGCNQRGSYPRRAAKVLLHKYTLFAENGVPIEIR